MLVIIAFLAATLAVLFLVMGVVALRRKRLWGTATSITLALLLLAIAALMGTISIATQGYRALTREEVAASVVVEPLGPQRFAARFTFPDGRQELFELAGDQIYVDAHILKWKPVANILGLHTAYELDRVGGRYVELDAERDSLRTLFDLSTAKPLDMFALRRKWTFFGPLLDAEYGSGTFVMADRRMTLEVRVSTSGLLIRSVTVP
ncbi:MAG: hypothetical protein OEO20_13565 [Gemmatimonadota bacterium]|nr:hypothetical protein [Gemmatimonadota bacterium]MDH3367191.1 hypothetical protein [Gemmatimonadota bacterium]MDH3479321.1 hypothetical protein [Gemmatimonadota bacterium]MDH5548830.1 hypothetical protein [Gemmatimonadota bacterium]